MYLRKKGVTATESNENGSLIVRLTCTIWTNVTVEGFNGRWFSVINYHSRGM